MQPTPMTVYQDLLTTVLLHNGAHAAELKDDTRHLRHSFKKDTKYAMADEIDHVAETSASGDQTLMRPDIVDHAIEFENETSRARQSAREDTKRTTDDEFDSEAKRIAPAHMARRDSAQEQTNGAQDDVKATSAEASELGSSRDGQDTTGNEPAMETTPLLIVAPWVRDAVAACQANTKNPLTKGTVLVVLDTKDFGRAILVDASIFKASDALARLLQNSTETLMNSKAEGDLDGLLVLSSTPSMPELVSMALDASLDDLLEMQTDNEHHSPAETAKARHNSAGHVKVKIEHKESAPVSSGKNWMKAYETFFRLLAGKKAHGIPKSDPETALPRIEKVVCIAQTYHAIPAIQGAFSELFFGYVGNKTFWNSISKAPERCINIAVALENLPVYEEAFKHLVGSSANSRARRSFNSLCDNVQALVAKKAHELYLQRRDVEENLMLITLPSKKRTQSDHPSPFVSQHHQPLAYSTVNIFRDWICEHIGHLRGDTEQSPLPSFLCDHSSGCDTVAGFFRTIATADDTYLGVDKVWKDFHDGFKNPHASRHNGHGGRESVKEALEVIKAKAFEYVKDINASTLHLPEKDSLHYLTCVEFGREDVPWDLGREIDSDEAMEED